MAANDNLQDLIISHQIGLIRLQNQMAGKFNGLLKNSEKAQRQFLLLEFEPLIGQDYIPNRKTIEQKINELSKMRSEVFDSIYTSLQTELDELVDYEQDYTHKIVEKAVGLNLANQALSKKEKNDVSKSLPSVGRTPKEWIGGIKSADANRVAASIRDGILSGIALNQLSSAVFGSSRNKYRDGQSIIAQRSISSVVATVVNGTTNKTRDTWARKNNYSEVVKWISVLDSRTSPICQSRDGNIYPIDEGPRPPAHIRCRSIVTLLMHVNGILNGYRPGNRSTKTLFSESAKINPNFSKLTKAEKLEFVEKNRRKIVKNLVGKEPAETTYKEFFSRQSETFQREVLGPTRYKLYKDGNLSLDKFVNDNTGKQYTLEQLKLREKDLFDKLDID